MAAAAQTEEAWVTEEHGGWEGKEEGGGGKGRKGGKAPWTCIGQQ